MLREVKSWTPGLVRTPTSARRRELAELMLDHDVGVSASTRYEIKRLDEDYFADEGTNGPAAVATGSHEEAAAPATEKTVESA